ncbi:hypothetical protein GNAINCEL_00045 [Serratia phage KKP 3709]|nr:hypothetical protein GNAINCEL_00045 [Serratia phage KKP 3709]
MVVCPTSMVALSTTAITSKMVLNGGVINCVNCWWEGYGPVDYIINIPESTTSVRLNIIGGLFSFKAGATGAESRATSNPFYFGTRAAVKFENVQFQKAGQRLLWRLNNGMD